MKNRVAVTTFLALIIIFLSSSAFAAQIKLGWTAPTTNADGTPLTDLAGYRVYYGAAAGIYGPPVDVPLDAVVLDNGVTTYTLTGLIEGQTYFIAVSCYRATYDESDLSNEVIGAIFTMATSPPGLQVAVDSVGYTAPQTFGWAVGSSHSLSTSSPQAGAGGTRYVYASWSDGGSQEHTIGLSHQVISNEAILRVLNMPIEDLVGYWAFDEGAGSVAYDASRYGNDANVFGAVWTEGKVGGALTFDGVGDHVRIPNSPSLDLTNQLTFAAWIYPTDLSGDYLTIAQRSRADLGWFEWQIYARASLVAYHPVFWVDWNRDGIVDADEGVEVDTVLDPNRWYFIACTYDGAQMDFYIDGILRGTTAKAGGSIPNGGRDIWIGGNDVWGEFFQGIIDEVRIYNRALSQDEIQALMTAGPTPPTTLMVNVVGNGLVLKNPDNTQYNPNEGVQLTAVPDSGWLFSGWSSDLTGGGNPQSIRMNRDKTVTATFIQQPLPPSIMILPVDQTVTEGQTTIFNAVTSGLTPASYQWQQWNDGAWTDIPGATTQSFTTPPATLADNGIRFRCLVMVGANMMYTANFTTQYSLTMEVGPGGGGTVSPSGTTWYDSGEIVSVSAVTITGYSFLNWTGDLSDSSNPASLIMDRPKSVTVNFTQDQYSLTVSVSPTGKGSVTKSPEQATYLYGDVVTLTATGNPGYTFSNWTGGVPNAPNASDPVQITITGNTSVAANFTQDQYSLTVSVTPTGKGSVNASQPPPYVYGDVVTLTAVANAGYTFSGWSGDASGTGNSVTVTMNSNKTVTANFTQDLYTLTVNVSPTGKGLVTKSPDKTAYVYGDQVQLSATGNPGYMFSGWGGSASGMTNPVTVTMNGNTSVTANFIFSLQMSLKAGYNLVSFPAVTGDIAITDLLSSISGQYTMVYAYEGCDSNGNPSIDPWRVYDPTVPPYVNDLHYVDSAMGIWIEAKQDVELTRQGLFASTLNIPLCVGWNLISYAGDQDKLVADALSSIAGKYDRVYSYRADDTANHWKVYDASVPPWVNDLVTIEPGLGYWIYIKENCTLVINN